ncbi:MAG: TetR family transcriptional regulator [Streptosporangiales bacterium]|nr:TetR family transcriptional regulator [Streptosporangiales bacterium]
MTEKQLRADARRNRLKVLEAAQQAFADAGVGVPLDDIARRAGVGAGTVYRHFPTKEALFEAVVQHRVEQLIEDAKQRARGDDPGEAFFGFLGRLADTAAAKKDLTDALAGAGVATDSNIAAATQEMQGALGVLLDRAQRAGAVRKDVTGEHLVALLKGALVAVQHGDDPDLGARVFAVLTDGLRA